MSLPDTHLQHPMADPNSSSSSSDIVEEALDASFSQKIGKYFQLSGPGWLQAAVTLGGGSLAGSLYLGIVGGYEFLWIQPLAMLCGIVMLGAISWITLTLGQRPFRSIQSHVSPTLAWAWLIATIVADTIFCIAQFSLGVDAIEGNMGISLGSPFVTTGFLFIVSFAMCLLYIGDGKSSKLFDRLLKSLVALVMISFFAVAATLLFSGNINLGAVILGLIPDFSALFRPVDTLQVVIDQTGEAAPFWSEYISSLQRDQIIAAFGSAVGINMTFLLPYTLQKRGWTKKHRELSFFDLALGLFVPFIIATGCLIVVSATMFHAQADDVLAEIDQQNIGVAQSYQRVLDLRADWLDDAEVTAPVGEADRQIGAMIFNRNAGQLAKALSPVLGEVGAQWIFGLGILAMAVSTIIIHQIMNGYAVSEAFNQAGNRKIFIAGALIPPIAGIFAPILWTGDAKIALIIPAAVTATTLLPLAYFAFFLLFNSKAALGPDLVTGNRRVLANTLMILAGGIATFASVWALVGRLPSWGFGARAGLIALVVLFLLALFDFYRRSLKPRL